MSVLRIVHSEELHFVDTFFSYCVKYDLCWKLFLGLAIVQVRVTQKALFCSILLSVFCMPAAFLCLISFSVPKSAIFGWSVQSVFCSRDREAQRLPDRFRQFCRLQLSALRNLIAEPRFFVLSLVGVSSLSLRACRSRAEAVLVLNVLLLVLILAVRYLISVSSEFPQFSTSADASGGTR